MGKTCGTCSTGSRAGLENELNEVAIKRNKSK